MTAPTANGTQPFAATPGSGAPFPYGEGRVGAEAPPPPPPTPEDGLRARLAEAERDLAGWESWAKRIEDGKRPKRRPSLDIMRRVPTRYVALGCGGVFVVAVAMTANRFTPQRYDAADITAIATQAARQQAVADVQGALNQARAESTQVVVADSFNWAPLSLTETAKTIIGYDAATNFQTLNQRRAEIVAKQAQTLAATSPLVSLRLLSVGPSDLRVTINPGEGVPLFQPMPTGAAASTATTVAPTATSAP